MRTKNRNQLLAVVLSIVMILSLLVVPVGAAVPVDEEPVAETPVTDAEGASLSSVQRPAAATLLAETTDTSGAIPVDVWDFGAEQLENTAEYTFTNHLTVDGINGWYTGMTDKEGNTVSFNTGDAGVPIPSATADNPLVLGTDLKYVNAGAYNHRLRTDNTSLTRDSSDTSTGDGNDPYVPGEDPETYHGLLYSNSSANTGVYLALECQSGDVVTAIVASNGKDSLIQFEGPTGVVEASDVFTRASRTKAQTMTFYAKDTGTYKIYSVNEKLVVDRLYRQHASEVAVSGTVTEVTGMPATYDVVFTNTVTGGEIVIPVANATYSGTLLAPYSYDVSLRGADGYAVLVGNEITVTAADTAVTHDLTIQSVSRVEVTGTITGLDADALAKLGNDLLFTPVGDGIVYVPQTTVNADGTYSVMVERNMPTEISALHINDYEITSELPSVFTGRTQLDLTFEKKATWPVTIEPEGVTAADLADATFTFTNLHEAGETEDQTAVPFNPYSADNLNGSIYNYSYTFTGTDNIVLRDGTYDVAVTTAAGTQKPTANVVVNGAAVTAKISFTPAASFVTPGVYDFTSGYSAGEVPGIDGIKFNNVSYHNNHGLIGQNGSTITLSLEDAANITLTSCCYGTGATVTATGAEGALEVTAADGTEVNGTTYAQVYTIAGAPAGDVTITFGSTVYVHNLTVESAAKVYPTEWDFGTWAAASGGKQGDAVPASVTKGITITGDLKSHASDYGVYIKNGSLGIPVSGPCTVTVSVGNSYDIKFPGDAEAKVATGSVAKKTPFSYSYEGEEGTVTVEFGSGATTYIDKITVEYANFEVPVSEWNFNNNSLEAHTFQTANSTEEWEGLTISIGESGKFSNRGATSWAQFTTGAKLIIPIYGGVEVGTELTISVNGYSAGDVKIGETTNTTAQDYQNFTITVDESHTVIIEANSANGYIGGIKVNYPEGTLPEPAGDIVYTVGTGKDFQTITDALNAAAQATREPGQRITIMIDPGDYEEQLYIKTKDLTLKNASETPSIALKDKGVGIDQNAVRITWYYGHGYTYYSMTNGHRYSADVLAANKANGYASYINAGAGSTDDSYWNASVLVAADGFQAEGIIFENSFNQYISKAAAADVIETQTGAKEGNTPRADLPVGSTKVQEKAYVERAGALSIKSGAKIFFNNCAFVGHQDTLYGPEGTTAAFYGCDIYGGTDYIYGGMTAVFAKCNLLFNTSEDNNDVGYITAPQQKSARGYLMWNCTVDSTTPGVNTAATYRSKPGYFGRPWEGGTGEAVFYATDIKNTDPVYYGYAIQGETLKSTSLITPVGWNASLGGTSSKSAELGTVEYFTGVDNSSSRVDWATVPSANPTVADFLGDWDPFEGLDMTISNQTPTTAPETTVPVTAVEITDPESTTLALNGKVTLTATVTPENATEKGVDWTSSDTSVLTVTANDDGTATVTAVGGGSAKIKASSLNHLVNDELLLTVNIPVESVTLDKESIQILTGRTTTVSATVAPENATNKSYTFASDTPGVATVDETGKIRAVADGTATITVTTTDGSKTDTVTVTVQTAKLDMLDVAAADVTGTYDGASSWKIAVTGAPEGAAVTYKTSLTADYAADEIVVADAGETTVYYKVSHADYNDFEGSAKITVAQAATQLVLAVGEGEDALQGEADADRTVHFTTALRPEGVSGTVTISCEGLDDITVDETGAATVVLEDVTKDYVFTAKYTDPDGNYADAESEAVTVSVTAVGDVNFSELNKALEDAAYLQETVKVSADGAGLSVVDPWASQETMDALDGAVADAQAVKGSAEADQAAVDAAVEALRAAIDAFVEKVNPSVIDQMIESLVEAKAALDEAEDSADGSDISKRSTWVTPDTRTAIQAAIGEAYDFAEAATAETTQEEVDAAKAKVDAALALIQDGTKKTTSGTVITNPSSTTTTTKVTTTNENGDVATTVTQPGGDRTITVENAEGETVAEISLPATIAAPATKFKDVPEGHWAEESINNMAGLGMVKGVNEAQDIFDMDSSMTRGAVATIFYRLSNGKEGTESTFADVAADAWYADAVGWAAKTGVVNGYSAEAFGPDDAITRQQLAVMLCRFANLVGVDTKTSGTGLTAFTDGDQVDDWAASGLAWCVKNGIMKGRGDGTLDPTANITRAESAAMFDRMIALLKQ